MRRRIKGDEVSVASIESAGDWKKIEELHPWVKNPRVNLAAVPRVAASIRRYGFVAPIIIDPKLDRMVAGDTRLKAMRQILVEDPSFVPKGAPGPGLVRVVFHTFDNEDDANAYAIADNRLNELAEWDEGLLSEQLARISAEDRIVIGMEDHVVQAEPTVLNNDEPPPLPAEPTSRTGDLFVLGRHRLLCGDSTKIADMKRLMNGDVADLLWTDPPYNVNYVGKTKDALKIENDQMDDVKFRTFLIDAFKSCDAVMSAGAVFYIAHADSEGYNFRGAIRDVGWKMAQCLIWAKDAFVMGRQDYHWKHEPLLYGWKLGSGHQRVADRTQHTLWEFPKPHRSELHPTMKPVELVEKAIANSTKGGAIVLDAFGGSGTTMIAAERTGRCARLIELDPRYVDVIVARWEHLTGQKAKRTRLKVKVAAQASAP